MWIPKLFKYSTVLFAAQNFQALDYFTQYDDSSSITTELSNFGLKSEYSWSSFLTQLNSLNNQSNSSKYKLIFLARHGEGWHNVLDKRSDWDYISRFDTFENYTLFDADLTPKGEDQIEQVSEYWTKELKNDSPYPDLFYVSPLRRTLHTYHITWSQNDDGIIPIVDEDLRERYGIQTPEKRHTKDWIAHYCPTCVFENGFTEQDELWQPDVEETKQHVAERATAWLKTVFEKDEQIVSVTTHSGLIAQLLKVIGHPKHPLYPGQLIPVVVKADS
ncbi:unnamed protein product [Wickerhamomyces anomalus]